jgi:hypothetical protein
MRRRMRRKLAIGAGIAAAAIGAVVAVARWWLPLAPHALPRAAPVAEPSRTWVIVALCGFALWLGGCVAFARRGLDAQDRLVPRAAAQAGGMVLAGMVVWLVGLYYA